MAAALGCVEAGSRGAAAASGRAATLTTAGAFIGGERNTTVAGTAGEEAVAVAGRRKRTTFACARADAAAVDRERSAAVAVGSPSGKFTSTLSCKSLAVRCGCADAVFKGSGAVGSSLSSKR